MIIPRNLIRPEFDLMPKPVSVDDLPEDERAARLVKLGMLSSLAWDYTNTVLDISSRMRIDALRAPSRAIRQIKREYDQSRSRVFYAESILKETELGQFFEEINADAFSKLCQGLKVETGHIRDLDDDNSMLVCAVQMAMTLIDAVKLYAADFDSWMESRGVRGKTTMPSHLTRLAILLPQFAGDCYDARSESRRITAGVLFNEIRAIETWDENGKINET